MIRSKTTLVVGAGASCEVEIPDGREMLGRIAQGFDFPRLGTALQTRDMQMLAKHFERLARHARTTREELMEAGGVIRTSARVGTSIDSILEQHNHDPLITAVGKLAIVHHTLQAEAHSPLLLEPRDPGGLPLRGNENWLFHLGRIVTAGVPRTKAEQCFDNLAIICFNYDRSIQHYLPFVLSMAFGMTLDDARQLVGAKLNIAHPFGNAGRLPWEPGGQPAVEWGDEEPSNLQSLATEILTASERMRDRSYVAALHGAIADSRKIVFLGFGFDPQNMEFLFDGSLSNDPDILAAVAGMGEPVQAAVMRMLKQRTGIEDESRISILNARCYQLLRDYALFLES